MDDRAGVERGRAQTARVTTERSAPISTSRAARLLLTIGLMACLAAPCVRAHVDRPSQPEPAGARAERSLAHARTHMVAAASPAAVEAGLAMLERGGAAVDAAIAVQLVLNLVEPHASGIGGGAFLLHYDAAGRAMHAYDGRETAPAAATPDMFVAEDGRPMSFRRASRGGLAVGVPGVMRLFELAHRRHGRLPWADLFAPAIALAEQGFALSPRVHLMLTRDEGLADDPAARALFFQPDGTPRPAGTRLTNPAFAATLRVLARDGADAFYTGAIARDIVAAVRGHARNPGRMTEADLAAYRVREVEPLCGRYRGHRICGMPPSSSGGIAVLQMLAMLERFDLARVRPGSTEAVHLFAEASRLAFADRDRYVADDRFARVPVAGLLDRDYLAARSALIRRERSMGRATAGVPAGAEALAASSDDHASGTSHISIVDRDGNAVAMTTTIETFFGSRVMARGFVLNNQLTDFSFVPQTDGRPVANAAAAGKRPRSSMAPKLVFDPDGALAMTVGAPGGSLIIPYVAKTLVGVLDWGLDMQAAIDLPNFGSRNGPTEIERGTALEAVAPALTALGHEVRAIDMTSGVQGILRVPGGWQGGADPRREGVARGR